MADRISIGVPTAGRPDSLAACIASIRATVTLPHRIIVLDSLPGPETRALCEDAADILYLSAAEPVGPAEARRRIAEANGDPYLMFLDDDLVVLPGAIERLHAHLEAYPDVGIAAGSWRESQRQAGSRELGQLFVLGHGAKGPVILKRFVSAAEAQDLGLLRVRVDGCLASMLVRRTVFDVARFDGRYDFHFDLFDFFLQCRAAGVIVEVLADVVFDHLPTAYQSPTLRQTGSRDVDLGRFSEKWGLQPVGRLSMPTSVDRPRRTGPRGGDPAPDTSAGPSGLRRLHPRLRRRSG